MSTSLSDVADVIRSDRIMSGANLVGKSVFAQTGRITTDSQNAAAIEFDLPYGADQVEVGIYDPVSGALMRSMVVGPQSSGTLSLGWDGRRPTAPPRRPVHTSSAATSSWEVPGQSSRQLTHALRPCPGTRSTPT